MSTASENPRGRQSSIWVADCFALLICFLAIDGDRQFWMNWLSNVDHVLFTTLTAIGACVGLYRSDGSGVPNRSRMIVSAVFLLLGLVVGSFGYRHPGSELSCVAIGLTLAGWLGIRVRDLPMACCVWMGVLVLTPTMVLGLESVGAFEWVTDVSLRVTEVLANSAEQPFAREHNSLWFRNGIADRFSSNSEWDSLVALLGVATFCQLSRRRNIATSLTVLMLTAVVWGTMRGVVWFGLSTLSEARGTWMEWSIGVQISVFMIEAITIVGLTSFLAAVLSPIPIELFDASAPFFSYLWNWICGLPSFVYRVPESSHIAKEWQVNLARAKTRPSLITDVQWLWSQSIKTLIDPIALLGGLIDAVRGWRHSRDWPTIWKSSAAWSIPLLASVVPVLSALDLGESRPQVLTDESERWCATQQLELASFHHHEPNFRLHTAPSGNASATDELTPIALNIKRRIELFCYRILGMQPKNAEAHYRLALIHQLTDRPADAFAKMSRLANGDYGKCPAANAWMAKELIIRRATDDGVSLKSIVDHLDQGSNWQGIDARLLRDYSRILEDQGDRNKAAEMAKKAAARDPELLLGLVGLYSKLRHPDLDLAADQAEAHYRKKVNIPAETEADRMALASACFLSGRLSAAIEVLQEGLRVGIGHDAVRRELSELQRLVYRRTIKKNSDGTFSADLSCLEQVIASDPSNPNISSEIAQLLPLRIRPTPILVRALQDQIDRNISSAATHLLIGESYFDKGNIAESMKHWQIAIDREQNNVIALNNLAHCLSQSNPPDTDRALELLHRAISVAPSNADVLDSLGGVLIQVNRHSEAINRLEMAIRLDTNHISARKKLAEAYKVLGRHDMAEIQEKAVHQLEALGNQNKASGSIAPKND